LIATPSAISATIKNTGTVAGAEVAQLYLAFPAAAGEPPLQLKGFQKTAVLAPGQSATVTFPLTALDTSIWSIANEAFVRVQGTFGVNVGSSSRDIRLKGSFAQ